MMLKVLIHTASPSFHHMPKQQNRPSSSNSSDSEQQAITLVQSKEVISGVHEADGDIPCISCKNLGHRGDWSRFQSRHGQNHKHPQSPLAEYLDRIESDDGAARHGSSAQLAEQIDLQS